MTEREDRVYVCMREREGVSTWRRSVMFRVYCEKSRNVDEIWGGIFLLLENNDKQH